MSKYATILISKIVAVHFCDKDRVNCIVFRNQMTKAPEVTAELNQHLISLVFAKMLNNS